MRLQVMSDLHLEFHNDWGEKFIAGLDPTGIDVLILAGDICPVGLSSEPYRLLSKRYSKSLILWVPGNHDYWGTSINGFKEVVKEWRDDIPNLWILLNKKWKLENGMHVLGTTMWFKKPVGDVHRHYADIHHIAAFEHEVFDANKEAAGFLWKSALPQTILVTHHIPLKESVSPRWKDSILNPVFFCDMQRLVDERSPYMWVHGHTHDSFDYMYRSTRVLCNPYGYDAIEINAQFNPALTINIPN